MTRGVAYGLLCAAVLVVTGVPGLGAPRRAVEAGTFSRSYLNPPELRFSCAGMRDRAEERYAEQLADAAVEPAERLAAARALWRGRSRRYVVEVLKFLAGPPPGGEPYRAFQREVETALRPETILRELRGGDYLWGTWLAFLRPHKDLVPALLAGLEEKPKMLPETMLALGNSGDPRALQPLLELLRSDDYRTAGDAARALGYLGSPDAEPKLIEALAGDNTWRQVNACGALAKLGTAASLPELEKLAQDNRYTGALRVKGMAEDAVQSIKRRENR